MFTGEIMKLSKALLKTMYPTMSAIQKQYPDHLLFLVGEVGYMTKKKLSIMKMTFSTGESHELYPLTSHSIFDRFLGYLVVDNESIVKVYKSIIPKSWRSMFRFDQLFYIKHHAKLNQRLQRELSWFYVPRKVNTR